MLCFGRWVPEGVPEDAGACRRLKEHVNSAAPCQPSAFPKSRILLCVRSRVKPRRLNMAMMIIKPLVKLPLAPKKPGASAARGYFAEFVS